MANPKFKVIIAGGSIAGLVLANMLEQLDIDFVVLEAYPEIAPQVGASIGIFPHGCRVLDQIGCFDGIRAKLDRKMTAMYIKSPEGTVLGKAQDASKHFIARHGYDPVFIDRQMAIQVFYEHLRNKSKVLTDKRVASVKQLKDGIEVTTKDGSTYTGDMLVGADGVHSAVRKEMWRLADELSPGYIPKADQTDVTCDYTCMFGISHPVEGFERESSHMITNHGRSCLVVDGPGGRIYWFLFLKNERTLRNLEGEIPRRFSKEEEKALAEKCWDDVIMEGVKFGDLYKSQMTAVMTALPEFVCTKWHFGRIFLVGDSVHKFNPISGQGGNSAIETAAALVTEIVGMLKATPSKAAPTDAAITAAFQRAQDARHARVSALVEEGHKQQAFMALETPLHEFIARQVVPRSPPDNPLAMIAQSTTGAARLPMLPMPRRPRFEPYDDELPAQPLGGAVQAVSWKVGAAVFAGLLAVAKTGMRIDFDLAPTQRFLGGAELRTRYTGIGPVDGMLALLSACFGDSVYGEDPSYPAQFAYLLALLFPVLIIWTVEGYRAANRTNILALPVLFGIAYQLQGIGVIAPLYFLLSAYLTSFSTHSRAIGRPVPLAAARAVLPATVFGFAVPTILMFLPYANPHTHQGAIAFWQFVPVWVALLTNIGKRALEAVKPQGPFDVYEKLDVPVLQDAYKVAFWLSALMHVAFSAFVALTSLPTVTFANMFTDIPNPLRPWSAPNWEEHLFIFVKYDFAFSALAILLWDLYTVWELRRSGFATTKNAVAAAVAVLVGQVLVGPGAVYAGLWWWREGQLAGEARLEGRPDDVKAH